MKILKIILKQQKKNRKPDYPPAQLGNSVVNIILQYYKMACIITTSCLSIEC